MKKQLFILFLLVLAPYILGQEVTITISTENSAILLQTDRDMRLRTIYVGKPLMDAGEYTAMGLFLFFPGQYHRLPCDQLGKASPEIQRGCCQYVEAGL